MPYTNPHSTHALQASYSLPTTASKTGARFGPRSIRAASARHLSARAFNTYASLNPYQSWASIVDCGDIPVVPFDNAVAVKQMTEAFIELGSRATPAVSGLRAPKFVALGGDHLVALPALRALRQIYGQPMALLHFDAHLDTLRPTTFPSAWESETTRINHGSVFWHATNEGLLLNGSCVHAGINTRITGANWDDYIEDDRQGFLRISADAIDDIGAPGIIDLINTKIGDEVPVYVSIDIDVLDPAYAPGTGAPEPGGWATRELFKIIRGLSALNVVGVDIVEVAPAYDTPGSDTAFVAAGLAYEMITNMVKRGDGPRSQNRGVPYYNQM